MQPHFVLKSMEQSTGHAPLAVLGYYWRRILLETCGCLGQTSDQLGRSTSWSTMDCMGD